MKIETCVTNGIESWIVVGLEEGSESRETKVSVVEGGEGCLRVEESDGLRLACPPVGVENKEVGTRGRGAGAAAGGVTGTEADEQVTIASLMLNSCE